MLTLLLLAAIGSARITAAPPPECNKHIRWARDVGTKDAKAPEWFEGFKKITGVEYWQASYGDMQRYFKCTKMHSTDCKDLTFPTDRNCLSPPCNNCDAEAAAAADRKTKKPGVEHEGWLCADECHWMSGYCNFCGTGKCCQLDLSLNGCDGEEGAAVDHSCVPSKMEEPPCGIGFVPLLETMECQLDGQACLKFVDDSECCDGKEPDKRHCIPCDMTSLKRPTDTSEYTTEGKCDYVEHDDGNDYPAWTPTEEPWEGSELALEEKTDEETILRSFGDVTQGRSKDVKAPAVACWSDNDCEFPEKCDGFTQECAVPIG